MTDYHHVPVLLKEVLEVLEIKFGQNVVDGTLGGGGYTKAILNAVGPTGNVLSIDLDIDAIENTRKNLPPARLAGGSEIKNLKLVHGNFAHIDTIIKNHDFSAPDAIVADIGFSSYELEQSGRGLSFQKKEPLDMRFDQASGNEDAKFILNTYNEKRLLEIFNNYGEEKFSKQIVRKIMMLRQDGEHIHYTTDLYEIIKSALPKPVKHKADDSARRIFQALRIAVNHELSNLEEFLPKAFNILAPGGRLAVVSFHSLEDRIVKQFFVGLTKGCVCPIDFPQCICGKEPAGKIITKKLVSASEEELRENPRSKPAKLRAIMKL